ncbi:MAG: hypothetical protein KatS3mg004_2391 [Bryobacteraceae bacterium]|nr:MAG: hypothetical protein KatS3mg004_2391 [Bryobacteraceae bacterium]
MPNNIPVRLSGLLLAALGGFAAGTQEPLINARDAFFSAADMVAVQKKTAAKKSAKTAPARRPEAGREPGKAAGPKPELAAAPPLANAEAYFQKVSQTSQNLPPLGLRYSLLKRTPQGLVEVSAETEFHAGDSIRLSVMGNRRGYLYVIARGSSGVWSPLFPHPESSQQSNEIVPGRLYQVPGGEGEYFTFDEQAGEERLFLVFSLKPVEDLEELVGALSRQGPALPRPAARPDTPPTLSAGRYDDAWMEQLRSRIQSRDLVFTKIDRDSATAPSPVGGGPEAAVYVVNASTVGGGSGEGRVVAELRLRHR